jgi:periplasmic protein TonB
VKQTNAPKKAYASRPIMSSKSDVTGPDVSANQVSGSRGNGLGTDKGLDPGGTSDKGDPNGGGGNDEVQSPPPPPPPPPPLEPPTKPKLKSEVSPDYPEIAKQNNWEGRVVVLARINESGEVEDASVAKSSGHPELDDAAVAAVKRARFEPATRDGKPVAGTVRVPISFSLN